MQEEKRIIKTDTGAKDGQNKCPKCGSTDISTNVKKGLLRCNFCRHEFAGEKLECMVSDLKSLHGEILASGAKDIIAGTSDIVTFKCSSCGAEVVLNTSESLNARCHWCRNILSQNEQIPNGAVPDVVLPFKIEKEEAKESIENFVGKRKFFAHPTFKKEFTTENIMGVYFPYMIIDVNAHSKLIGQGEHQVRSYSVKEGDHYRTYYDADLYDIEREFDLVINGLTVESNIDRLNKQDKNKTNNIINSIMPFDTENCIKYNAHYLQGFSSEKRDTNTAELKDMVLIEAKDIARFSANDTLKQYDRGVRWDSEELNVKGLQWTAAYLPVWLYSYQEKKGEKSILHYVAVNARTKETMGSVPIHMPKLIAVSIIVEILGIISMYYLSDFDYNWIFLFTGFVFFFIMYSRYRNAGARHRYETETEKSMSNLKAQDRYITRRTRLSSSTMSGANNKIIQGENRKSKMVSDLLKQKEREENNDH